MRRVGRQIAEEGLAVLFPLKHPAHRLAEPEVSAVAVELLHNAFVAIAPIEVVVVKLQNCSTRDEPGGG